MILIPEIEVVVILTPRTGTKSLRLAIRGAFPQSMQIYRHMEADGVPAGYHRWRRVGVVRHPLDRLWSLYSYLKVMGTAEADDGGRQDGKGKWEPAYVARQRRSAELPFSDWIVQNETVFTSPYDSAGARFWPAYTVLHCLPENRKSQFIYLRPDLGTEVWRFDALADLAADLGVDLGHHHALRSGTPPEISPAAADHMQRFFAWDYEAAAAAGSRVAA